MENISLLIASIIAAFAWAWGFSSGVAWQAIHNPKNVILYNHQHHHTHLETRDEA